MKIKTLKIILVGTIGCSGTHEADKVIKEVIDELNVYDFVEYEKVIYTGTETTFNPPIFGSPTVLIDGNDLVFDTNNLPVTLA